MRLNVKAWDTSKDNNFSGSSWHKPVFKNKNFIKLVNAYVKELSAFYKKQKFNAIAFMGISGSPLGGAISYALGVPMIQVRKSGNNNHSGISVIGHVDCGKYVIVDDLISSGATVRRIIKEIKGKSPKAKPVGIFLYDGWNKKLDGINVYRVKVK